MARVPLDADPESFCRKCLGPRGYRRTIEAVRNRLAAGEPSRGVVTCRRCGGPTFLAATLAVRESLGLELGPRKNHDMLAANEQR